MSEIANKLKVFDFSQEEFKRALEKHSINIAFKSFEELEEINYYLKSKGINLTKAIYLQVCANNLNTIKYRVEAIEALGDLDLIIEDPRVINYKQGYLVLKYLKENDLPYKTDNNKYASYACNRVQCEKKGYIDHYQDLEKEEKLEVFKENEPVVNNLEEVKENNFILFEQANETNLKPIVNEEPEIEVRNFVVEDAIKEEKITPIDEGAIEYAEPEYTDEIEKIFATCDARPLDGETGDKVLALREQAANVFLSVKSNPDVNPFIVYDICRLVTNGIEDDKEILLRSILHNGSYSDAEVEAFSKAIDMTLSSTRSR